MSKRITCLLLFILAIVSCYDEEIALPGVDDQATLNLESARAYFEENAPGLNSLSFNRQELSRDVNNALLENNVPVWDEAEVLRASASTVVEIPIFSDQETWVYRTRLQGEEKKRERSAIRKKLIVSQRDNGHMNMFVVTFVPEVLQSGLVSSQESFPRYYGGTFTGWLFCSDLEGNLLQCFKYRDGVNLGVAQIAYKSDLEKAGVSFGEGDEFLCFAQVMTSRSYGSDETGGGDLGRCPHGSNPETCPICATVVVVPHYCPGGCGRDLDWESCTCCSFCHRTPCVCPRCSVCGERQVNCSCQPCPICHQTPCRDICSYCHNRYCHGQCHTEPGGGGGSGGVPPSENEMTIEELKAMVFTPEFLANLQELGLTLDAIEGIDFCDTLSPTANAAYFHDENRIAINPNIFTHGYSDMDITSIIFHEFVHAKQAIIDNRVVELNEKREVVMTEYDFPYDDYKVQLVYEDFLFIMQNNGPENRPVPESEELRTDKEKEYWDYYFDVCVQPALDAQAAGETYKHKVNYIYSLNEKEAYETEMQKYGALWSEEYRKDAMAIYKMYKHDVEVLQNKN